MARREQSDQLLKRIDSVLTECSKDPRRRPARRPARPAWQGPSWARDEWARAQGRAAEPADGRSS